MVRNQAEYRRASSIPCMTFYFYFTFNTHSLSLPDTSTRICILLKTLHTFLFTLRLLYNRLLVYTLQVEVTRACMVRVTK